MVKFIRNGTEHICQAAGISRFADVYDSTVPIEQNIIAAVRDAASDSSVRAENTVVARCPHCPSANIYKVDTPRGSYFVKPLGLGKFEVKMEPPVGPFGCATDVKVRAKQADTDLTIFYLEDVRLKVRVGPYYYIQW